VCIGRGQVGWACLLLRDTCKYVCVYWNWCGPVFCYVTHDAELMHDADLIQHVSRRQLLHPHFSLQPTRNPPVIHI
jgi:hypothetical protein